MNRVTSALAIGTLALFTGSGLALAQSASDAAASGSPSAAPAAPAAESPAPAQTEQGVPSDEPAQAGGMHNTSNMKSNGKKPCEPTIAQPSSTERAKTSANCEKPK